MSVTEIRVQNGLALELQHHMLWYTFGWSSIFFCHSVVMKTSLTGTPTKWDSSLSSSLFLVWKPVSGTSSHCLEALQRVCTYISVSDWCPFPAISRGWSNFFFFFFFFFFFCLCILHQSYLTITAGTANCPILGDWVPVYTSFGGSWGL